MIVKLAGFNIDIDILKKINRSNKYVITPETFSAAYARISRSSKDVSTLRKEACKDVERARKSNQRIIFEMGHHSVAEHAVFNFDIMKVSRLALEEIEKFRLVSYTEKSQRYVKLDGDFVVPKEIKNKKLRELFKNVVNLQNEFYQYSYKALLDFCMKEYTDKSVEQSVMKIIEGKAKEDARYILPLATEGQVGLTINARNLEHLFRRFSLSKRIEIQELGGKMFELVKDVAPSIILFPSPSEYEKEIYSNLNNKFQNIVVKAGDRADNIGFKIINYSEGADEIILASIISRVKSIDFHQAFDLVKNFNAQIKESIYKELFNKMQFYDVPPREFELAEITFQAIISASSFAQLKRHRMATLVASDYDINLGNTVPESIKDIGLENQFMEIIERTNKAYKEIKEIYGDAADYILTNSHRRRVIVRMNLREVYHFVRLRADKHAQWDIRQLAQSVKEETKKRMPYSSLFLCGKDELSEKNIINF